MVCPDLDGFHLECKRRGDRFSAAELYKAMTQAERDALPGQVPVVIHRIDGEKSLATMRLDEWIDMAELWNNEG